MTGIRKEYDVEFLLSYIKEFYKYSQKDKGLIFKKANAKRNTNRIGKRIGNKHPSYGYVSVRIRGKFYREHYLVFILFREKLPKEELDHINKVPDDNRIENLRECSRSQNCANRRNWNKSFYKGVRKSRNKKKWCAIIKNGMKNKMVGTFDTAEEAARAYDKAAKEIFGEFATLNFGEQDAD